MARQKKADKALKVSQDKFEAILETVADHVSIIDEDLNIVWANQTARSVFGDDLVGRKCYEAYHRREEPCEQCLTIRTFHDGRVHEHETEVTDKDGNTIQFHCTSSVAMRDKEGKPAAVVEISRDITEDKSGQERLRESEERYRSFLQNFQGIAFQGDLNFRPIFALGAIEKLTGYTGDELTAGKPRWDQIVHPDDLPQIRDVQKRASSTPNYSTEYEYRIVRKDGETIWVHEFVRNLCDENWKPISVQGAVFDVTERRRIEEELKERDERLRSQLDLIGRTFDSMTDAIFILDANIPPTILECNNSASTVFGYKEDEMLGKTTEFLHANDESLKKFQGLLYRAIEENRLPFRLPRFEMKRKDGTIFTSEHSVSQLSNEEGERIGWISIVRDLSKLSKMEDDLKRSEIRYQDLAEHISEALGFIDANWTITYVNTPFAEMLGYAPEEMIGKKPLVFVDEESRDLVMKELEKCRKGIDSRCELDLLSKTGEKIRVFASSRPMIENAGFVGAYTLMINISERRRMENALRESERRNRTIVENVSDFIYLVDENGSIISVNSSAASLFGAKPEELVGKSIFDLFPRESAEDFLMGIRRAFKMGSSDLLDGRMIVKGREFQIDTILNAVRDEEGKIVAVLGVTRDITEKKTREEREKHLYSLIEHDLRNKFQDANHHLRLLQETRLTKKQEGYLRELQGSCKGLDRIIGLVSDLWKVDDITEKQEIDLNLTISDAIEETSTSAETGGVGITYKGISEAKVIASPLLVNVFTNLIQNSIIHAACKKITITIRELKDRYRVTVEDDGKGMPNQVKETLYQIGVKGSGSTGSGLGLHLVKKIIDASDGEIELRDTKKGTRFDIYLKKTNVEGAD